MREIRCQVSFLYLALSHIFVLIAFIHTYTHRTLDNMRSSHAQGLNLRRGWSLDGKRIVDINDEQTDGFLNR